MLAVWLLAGCRPNRCAEESGQWIKEAPLALEEFLVVKKEILTNQALLDSFTKGGKLFLVGAGFGPEKFGGFNVPQLKLWFRKGHEYISFEPGDTVACYRGCENGGVSGSAYLRSKETKYNSQVEIIDSLKLGMGWFAEVIVCRGCGS
ncbi:MAG: hypothetical protein JWP69_145 [Flaviaesturariibacter sp.]|nr:hypothetical protein [Flaviaesturariibacter sp.]